MLSEEKYRLPWRGRRYIKGLCQDALSVSWLAAVGIENFDGSFFAQV